jgi:mannosyl-3-phosphoglycerate synthase
VRIDRPRKAERFGAVVVSACQQVYELDSGLLPERGSEERSIVNLPYEQLYEIERQMAIVVPVRGERIRLVEGVLSGIPNQCLIIVVSNSPREPVDRFAMEKDAVEGFARHARHRVVVVHQKDPVLAQAFAEAGYGEILDEQGRIRDGKAEGMIAATVLAGLARKKYIGFVDSDNYFPGAVHEYVRIYSAGFALARSRFSMVRIAWHSKPKIVDSEVQFAKWGRCSRVTNRRLNRLMGWHTGFETDVIETANAGEHALTFDLAAKLEYGTGYSVETYHWVNLFEQFGGVLECPFPEVLRERVEVYQVESRNPHFHDAKDDRHIRKMIAQSLAAMYESRLCPEPLEREIEDELRRLDILGPNEPVPLVRRYPAPIHMDQAAFSQVIQDEPYARLVREEVAARPVHWSRPRRPTEQDRSRKIFRN